LDILERFRACVNYCAGVDIPNKVGGLRELIGIIKEGCEPDELEQCCCPKCIRLRAALAELETDEPYLGGGPDSEPVEEDE